VSTRSATYVKRAREIQVASADAKPYSESLKAAADAIDARRDPETTIVFE
jgi:hypothetical protein